MWSCPRRTTTLADSSPAPLQKGAVELGIHFGSPKPWRIERFKASQRTRAYSLASLPNPPGALPADAENTPENWKNLFGWEARTVPSPKRAAAPVARPEPSSAANCTRPVAAGSVCSTTNALAESTRKRNFEEFYAKVRKRTLFQTEMGSVSDLLTEMSTGAAKRAKPTVGEKMPRWENTFDWPPHYWTKSPHFRSRTGGGKHGLGASKAALNDIHKHLFDP